MPSRQQPASHDEEQEREMNADRKVGQPSVEHAGSRAPPAYVSPILRYAFPSRKRYVKSPLATTTPACSTSTSQTPTRRPWRTTRARATSVPLSALAGLRKFSLNSMLV